MLTHSILSSPLGPLHLVTTPEHQVAALDFEANQARLQSHLARHNRAAIPGSPPPQITAALSAYFAGDLEALAAIATTPAGTPFQHRVWAEVRAVPPGQTRSYAQIAQSLGQPSASRAIGMANAQNPILLLIPCHRIIGTTGRLTGYAGGAAHKDWLLTHEGARAPRFL